MLPTTPCFLTSPSGRRVVLSRSLRRPGAYSARRAVQPGQPPEATPLDASKTPGVPRSKEPHFGHVDLGKGLHAHTCLYQPPHPLEPGFDLHSTAKWSRHRPQPQHWTLARYLSVSHPLLKSLVLTRLSRQEPITSSTPFTLCTLALIKADKVMSLQCLCGTLSCQSTWCTSGTFTLHPLPSG